MSDYTIDGVSRSLAGATSRRQMLKVLGGGLAGGAALATGLTLQQTSAQGNLNLSAIPIRGVIGGVSRFVGTFNLQSFQDIGGQLVAIGTLTGTLTNLATGVTQQVNQVINLPVTIPSGTCQILRLELGPLDLTLLGLRVQLNRVVLNITAQRGGGLLGDLLCSIANLLNGGGPLAGLATLLNQLLGALGGV